MKAAEFCNREVVVVERDSSVLEAAQIMRKFHVGSVVVVEKDGQLSLPIGVLTDRDIVLELVSQEIPVHEITVGDAMSYELVTVGEDATLSEVVDRMNERGVQRVPVVGKDGELIGLVARDDALELIAEQLEKVASLVNRQQRRETKQRPS